MGYNTVAVLYNDHTSEIERSGSLGSRIANAMRSWLGRDRHPMDLYFGAGKVISQEHADYSQVVIVGQNTGQRACDTTELDYYAAQQMIECLERNGYRVTKRRKPTPPSTGDE